MLFKIWIKIKAFWVGIFPHLTVVVDTETTGINDAELLQVSLITETGRVLFNKYIKPDDAEEWPDAQKINHISPGMVKYCRHFSDYVPLINAYLRHTKKLIGFNVERFDLPILEEYGVTTDADTIDVMLEDFEKRTKKKQRREHWRRLPVVARSYGYFFAAHDALEDCLATLHIYSFMHLNIGTVGYLLRKICRIAAGAAAVFYIAPYGEPYLYAVIACFCYIYGPFTGLVSICAGLILTGISTAAIPILAMTALLGFFSIMVKSAKPWLFRFVECFATTILSAVLALYLLPISLNGIMQIPLVNLTQLVKVMTPMVLGIPVYFIANTFIKRIL